MFGMSRQWKRLVGNIADNPKRAAFPRVAVLIDADNVSGNSIAHILEAANAMGSVETALAFGSPEALSCDSWRKGELELGIRRRVSGGSRAGKNSTDIFLTVACMDMLSRDEFDVLLLCSSDSDFPRSSDA